MRSLITSNTPWLVGFGDEMMLAVLGLKDVPAQLSSPNAAP
jgi:hypothetical protein